MLQLVLTQAVSRAEQPRLSIPNRIATWGHTQWHGYQARRRYRKTVQTLSGLDDRTLHDIGVHRSEIEFVRLDGRHRAVPGAVCDQRSVSSRLSTRARPRAQPTPPLGARPVTTYRRLYRLQRATAPDGHDAKRS